MKKAKIIAYIIAQLLRLWVTACAAVMMYVPMSALAYAQRGYRAVGQVFCRLPQGKRCRS